MREINLRGTNSFPSEPFARLTLSISLMHVDIKLANFIIKSRFKDENCKFYHEQIPKAQR